MTSECGGLAALLPRGCAGQRLPAAPGPSSPAWAAASPLRREGEVGLRSRKERHEIWAANLLKCSCAARSLPWEAGLLL